MVICPIILFVPIDKTNLPWYHLTVKCGEMWLVYNLQNTSHNSFSTWPVILLIDGSYSNKNDRNGGIWQSGISKSLAEYVQRPVCFVNVQLSLHENVVFSVCVRMCNAAYVILITWNSISGLDACYHFRLNISSGVALTVRSHKKK